MEVVALNTAENCCFSTGSIGGDASVGVGGAREWAPRPA